MVCEGTTFLHGNWYIGKKNLILVNELEFFLHVFNLNKNNLKDIVLILSFVWQMSQVKKFGGKCLGGTQEVS